ncbi:hypothetical protein Tco_0453204 [Tanacetum coccineum]
MSNKGSLITRKPIERQPIELLKWYGYDTDLYQGDEFPGTNNDTIDNASSDEDTIQESQSPNSEANVNTWDDILKKFGVRKVKSGAAKGKGKKKV